MAETWHSFQAWLEGREELLAWTVSLSVLTFFGTLVAVPIVLTRMRRDYFVRSASMEMPRTPLRLVRRILKNALGGVLLLSGIAMLVLPGQGLITIALGVSLLDFPGKRAMQLRIVRLRGVRGPINWIRKKANKPPLVIPDATGKD